MSEIVSDVDMTPAIGCMLISLIILLILLSIYLNSDMWRFGCVHKLMVWSAKLWIVTIKILYVILHDDPYTCL